MWAWFETSASYRNAAVDPPQVGAIRRANPWRVNASSELYTVACYSDFFQACTDLAYLKSEPEKQALFERGCAGGSMEGCNGLAFIIEKEKPKEALALYKKACDGNDARACNNLAFMKYKEGSLQQSFDLYEQACKMGLSEACAGAKRVEQLMRSNTSPELSH